MPLTDEQLAAEDTEQLTPEEQAQAAGMAAPGSPGTADLSWGNFGDYLRGAGAHLLDPRIGMAAAALGPAGSPLQAAIAAKGQYDLLGKGAHALLDPSEETTGTVDREHRLPDGYAPPAPNPGGPTAQTGYQPKIGLGGGVPGFDYKSNQHLANLGFQSQMEGGEAEAKAQADAQTARAAAMAQAASERIALAKQQEQDHAAAAEQAKADMLQSKQNWDEFRNSKTDPDHWWATRSGAQKAFAGLGLALSQMGAAFTHQQPVNLISEAIDRDVHVQEANAAKLKDYASAQDNVFARNYAQTKDAIAARAMTKSQYIDGILAQGDAVAAKSASQATMANWQLNRGKLQEMQSQLDRQAYGQLLSNGLAKQQMAKNSVELDMLQRQQGAQQAGAVAPALAVYVDDPASGRKVAMRAPDEKSAQELRQVYSDSSAVLADIAEAKALAKKWGSSFKNTEAGAQYKAKLDGIITKLNHAQGVNQAVDENQRKLYMETFGNGTTTPTAATLKGLEGLEQTLRTGVSAKFGAVGLPSPFGAEPRPDAKQNVVAKYGVK